jgi:superfamily II DNA or RNA helicase
VSNLRKHQAQAQRLFRDIASGVNDQKIVTAHVTPGGGKTLMCSVAAHELIVGNDVDHVCIVCPRDGLTMQMADSFTSKALGLPLGIRHLRNEKVGHRALFPQDRAGYVTTYQSIVAAPSKHARVLSRDRWLLVLDESQLLGDPTVKDSGTWKAAVEPLVQSARRVLLMCGSMVREDRVPLAFVPYGEDKRPVVDIRYARRDALEEKAILPVSVQLCDGKATYWHRYQAHDVSLSNAAGKEEGRALNTLLGDEKYRAEMVMLAIADWEKYRGSQYASRMIIICQTQEMSRAVATFINETTRWRATLAISDEGDAAKRLIARFRDKREGDILVTCQMAYIGLDVPDCTHLVCLTNIRSRSWLDQAFARVTRFNRACALPWEEQCAFWYVPNDPSMVQYLDEALDEQDEQIEEHAKLGGVSVARRASTFTPISGDLTEHRFGDTHGVFSDVDNRRVERVRAELPFLKSHPAREALQVSKMIWQDDAAFEEAK